MMGHKQKGQLAVSKEWAKHLRKFWRRQYWKMERRAGKNKIRKDRMEAIAARFYRGCALVLFGLLASLTTPKGNDPLDAIPSSFRYRSAFERIAFLPGARPLLISRYETSNAEYKEFLQYVRDSLRETDVSKLLYALPGGQVIPVYPDTLVWLKDFAYTVNEPFTRHYFSSSAFAAYPVVGISQKQALAYCDWKTRMWNKMLAATGDKKHRFLFSLPTRSEWEHAAWEKSPFTVLDRTQTKGYPMPLYREKLLNKGYKYNFGLIKDDNNFRVKDYADDGAFFMAPCNAYKPNANGIFNLCGNVAEWTLDTTAPSPGTDSAIVKGGSWCSGASYLQPAADQHFACNETHSYLGFRVVLKVIQP